MFRRAFRSLAAVAGLAAIVAFAGPTMAEVPSTGPPSVSLSVPDDAMILSADVVEIRLAIVALPADDLFGSYEGQDGLPFGSLGAAAFPAGIQPSVDYPLRE